jgi:hypothetical protein
MIKGTLAALTGACCLFAIGSAWADSSDYPGDFGESGWTPGTTKMVTDVGFNGGGDKVTTVNFDGNLTSSIYAGNGLFADFGVQRNLSSSPWSFKATAGFDYWYTGSNQSIIRFSRFPLDLLALYSSGDHHFGFGLTEHFDPHLNMDGAGPNQDFSNATGVVLQYQYWLFGVRATSIHYKITSACTSSCNLNASSIGMFFNYAF